MSVLHNILQRKKQCQIRTPEQMCCLKCIVFSQKYAEAVFPATGYLYGIQSELVGINEVHLDCDVGMWCFHLTNLILT